MDRSCYPADLRPICDLSGEHGAQRVAFEDATWWWNPLSYVTDDTKAAKLATHFASGTRAMNAKTDAYFDGKGQELLSDLLLAAAADKLAVPIDALTIADGVVGGGGKTIAYGALVAGDVLHVEAAVQDRVRDPKTHTIVGRTLPRIDIPAKVTGGAAYVQDLRLPRMAHGRVVRPPSPDATLRSFDAAEVERMPGVVNVVRDGRFIGLVAEREWQAIVAMRRRRGPSSESSAVSFARRSERRTQARRSSVITSARSSDRPSLMPRSRHHSVE